jgi:glycerol uptake facilitator-like aquaporin
VRQSKRAAIIAEFLGTTFLVAAVVGSGIMGERLADGNSAIALLANSVATGAMLVVLIATLGPLSGAHFNPIVTLAAYHSNRSIQEVWSYLGAQVAGALTGTVTANLMFGLSPLSFSQHARTGTAQLFSEFVATFGLLMVILVCSRFREAAIPYVVAAYITAAYWFTASTSFANPAVTIARAFTDTFAGIRPGDVPGFVIAQALGGASAVFVSRWMMKAPEPASVTDRHTGAMSKKGSA